MLTRRSFLAAVVVSPVAAKAAPVAAEPKRYRFVQTFAPLPGAGAEGALWRYCEYGSAGGGKSMAMNDSIQRLFARAPWSTDSGGIGTTSEVAR